MKHLVLLVIITSHFLLFTFHSSLLAQPRYDRTQMNLERLNRGVVAIRSGENVVVSWRTLFTDAVGEPFDVYRDGQKLNSQPLRQGGTFFVDETWPHTDAVYEVRGGGKNGTFTLRSDAPDGYISVALQKPEGGTTPDGRTYEYTANDASVADVDGDGEYEILLKWDPTNAHDNAHDGYTGPTIFDCYKIVNDKSVNRKFLWRINLGINIRSGAHYVPFIFYDLDGDGRAEFIVRTSDGTRDGVGNVIGDSLADYRHQALSDAKNPTSEHEWGKYNKQGRPMTGRILTGNEYITVFNGLTGAAMDSKPYIPERGNLSDWGDNYANRSDRFLAGVGYFDGQRASAVFCRGYYTRTVLAAWDWNGKELKSHWVFDTNAEGIGKDGKPLSDYAGQGNHNLRVADVDGDGCDEILYGSMAVDHDGLGLYTTGMGHGDAIHLMAFDPSSTELQIWDCHENCRDGSDFRNARTGEIIFQIPSKSDVGRAMAADIDPTNPGVEMWSSDSHGIRTIKGEVLNEAQDPDDPQHQQHLKMKGRRLPINFGIWWDGDLLRELLDHETVSKYDWTERSVVDVVKFPGIQFNNGTKSNPCLAADILGDWREEVMARTPDSSELRIFVSSIPTDYRVNCLMEDIPYRLSTAAQNVGYNQPSEPGFYLGPDKVPATMAAQESKGNFQKGDYGYLYCHMNDRGRAWTAYALSRDGMHYHDLLNGDSIFSDSEHARIEGATRDAYIFRKHDGTGYLMLCTDMNVGAFKQLKKQAEWDNYGIDLLRSDDLLHWESVTFDFRQGTGIFSNPEAESVYKDWKTVNRVWAPQAVWDEDYVWPDGRRGGYFVYYSMWNRAEEQYDRMYYSYADESFTQLTQPRLLFDWGYATIDADINWVKADRQWHMMIKKEGGTPGLFTTSAPALTGPWPEPSDDDYVNFEGKKKCEGVSAFQLAGHDDWVIGYIEYSSRPKNYRLCLADETMHNFREPRNIEGVDRPQHGSFLRITKEEYDRLQNWSDSRTAEVVWFDGQHPITFCLPEKVEPIVETAVEMWKDDMRQVTGVNPVASDKGTVRIVHTPALPSDGFRISVKAGHVIVEGSNGRGMAYGLLELSRIAGVSPWIWWGDVVPEKRQQLVLRGDFETEQRPSVAYRGIFINDEDWSFRPWSGGQMTAGTYKKLFQLLLRLRANTIWPAMHPGTTAFFKIPGAKAMADSCGIVVGTSHCEPLLRNNVDEWDTARRGPFNYRTNWEAVQQYWIERLKEVRQSKDNMFTIGMRGIHDSSMEGYQTEQEKLDGLQQVINDQQQLLAEYVGDPAQQMQVFVPYKEVLQLYNKGLQVPDYVTLMWCDDNYGYMTRLSDMQEQQRSGGAGVYYHLSYWGRPHDYLWLTTTQPGLIYHEMRQAYDHQVRRLWIANVHDPKVAAYDLELFLDMAWNIGCVTGETLDDHLTSWLCRQFGEEAGQRLFPVMHGFYRLCGERRPEFMGYTQVELDKKIYPRALSRVSKVPLTPAEAVSRLSAFEQLKAEVVAVRPFIRQELTDAFYAAVEYPVFAAAAMNRKILSDSAESHRAYIEIQSLTRRYNEMNGGKWRHLMDAAPRRLPVFEDVCASLAQQSDEPRCMVNACDYAEASDGVRTVQMLGHSMNAIAVPKNGVLKYLFDVQQTADYVIHTHFIPTQPNDDGDLRYSISIDDEEPVVYSLKEPFRSERWKENVLCGQTVHELTIPLSAGRHVLEVKVLDHHVVFDQWSYAVLKQCKQIDS